MQRSRASWGKRVVGATARSASRVRWNPLCGPLRPDIHVLPRASRPARRRRSFSLDPSLPASKQSPWRLGSQGSFAQSPKQRGPAGNSRQLLVVGLVVAPAAVGWLSRRSRPSLTPDRRRAAKKGKPTFPAGESPSETAPPGPTARSRALGGRGPTSRPPACGLPPGWRGCASRG